MASLTISSGGSQPVFATDTLNGSVSSSTYLAGVPTNFMGPKLDFFGVDLGADPSGEAAVNEMLQTLLQSIQQLATVAMYQVQASAAANNFSVAVYPTAAYDAASLQVQIRALGTVSGYDLSGAVVTNVGFKLAAS